MKQLIVILILGCVASPACARPAALIASRGPQSVSAGPFLPQNRRMLVASRRRVLLDTVAAFHPLPQYATVAATGQAPSQVQEMTTASNPPAPEPTPAVPAPAATTPASAMGDDSTNSPPAQPAPAAEPAPAQSAPAAEPAPVKTAQAAEPAPAQPAPAAEPAPAQPAPAAEPAPVQPAPAAEPAPVKTAPASEPAPAQPAPAAEFCLSPSASGGFGVLAAGDSLTLGAVPSEYKNHPYAWRLDHRLKEKLGQGAYVVPAGLAGGGFFQTGFTIDSTFIPFVNGFLDKGDYRLVVMMVGINDLLRGGVPASDIMPTLEAFVQSILNRGIPLIIMPPMPAPGFISQDDAKEGERLALAAALKALAAERKSSSSPTEPQIWVLDLQSGPMNFNAMDPTERAKHVDDGLHLTPYGYDAIGELVNQEVQRHLCART